MHGTTRREALAGLLHGARDGGFMSETRPTSYVPADSEMSEFTLRALVIGIFMCVILGAANAYLGLRAGMTIAATYPAAVIGMAVLKLMRGSLLEENFARTVGSIGESVAAGAAFTLPAFVILKMWKFDPEHMMREYLLASALMVLGGTLGIMFVTILRRVMVEDTTLPFPESVAASEIHKAGQRGAEAAMQLFRAMGVGALIELMGNLGIFRASNTFVMKVGEVGRSILRFGSDEARTLKAGGVSSFSAPAVSPAYLGVGYIIGPELGALNFAGGLLAWGLFVPLLVFFLGPGMIDSFTVNGVADWGSVVDAIYRRIVRPIAVGGMLVGACYTLYRMRQRLAEGLRRSVADVKKSATQAAATKRTERDIKFSYVMLGIATILILMVGLYYYFTHQWTAAIVAGIVMLVTGFFFAAVSGNLVGTIGSSNNPLSGLTLATTIIAALTMVIVGAKGAEGVAAVLGVAAVGCVSAAVAGEMLQDLKVGHILGGTPWKMQAGDLIGVVAAGLFMFFPFYMMHTSDIAQFGEAGGFGGKTYPAPQAGLMAALSQGIVGGEMAWPLVIVGIAMGVSLILIKVRSPMLFSVGMYLPLETTFAIFVGSAIRGVVDKMRDKRGYNAAQKARVENAGILAASGLIAGQSLTGLLVAAVIYFRSAHEFWSVPGFSTIVPLLNAPLAQLLAVPVVAFIVWYLIAIPLRKAGDPDEPAPPTAVM
jgi:putative OPT family oligopeptide transporter